LAKYFIPVN